MGSHLRTSRTLLGKAKLCELNRIIFQFFLVGADIDAVP